MTNSVLLILLSLYFPIFSQMTGFGRDNQITLYYIFLMLLSLGFVGESRKKNYLYGHVRFFSLYFIATIILTTEQFIVTGLSARTFLAACFPYALSLFIFHFLYRHPNDEIKRIIEKVFRFIVIAFFIQFVLSIYESSIGHYIGVIWEDPDGVQLYSGWENRVVLNVLGNFTAGITSSFQFPLSGLLGQHNNWGAQLPFYNLIILMLYHETKEKKFIVGLIAIVAAIVFNTSRFGFAGIAATDIFYLGYYFPPIRKYIIILSSIVIAVIIYTLNDIITLWENYQALQPDTLQYRVNNYSEFWKHLGDLHIGDFLFGIGLKDSPKYYEKIMGFPGNFESSILMSFFQYGIIGLLLLMYLWKKIFNYAVRFKNRFNPFIFLLFVNIISVSITVNGISYYFVLPFVVLIFIHQIASRLSMTEENIVLS